MTTSSTKGYLVEFGLHEDEKYMPTPRKNDIASLTKSVACPCYVQKYQDFQYKGKMYHAVSYGLHFDVNGAIGIGYSIFPKSKFLGYHLEDNEKVIILLDITSGLPQFVYFSAHSRGQGQWKAWNDCDISQSNILNVHVARASHAMYAEPGIKWRIFGFANDKCSRVGKSKFLNVTFVEVPNIGKPAKLNIPQSSMSKLQMFFIPFSLKYRKNAP